MEVYRFRNMDYLLGESYQEFDRQTIYFASPDQLNDPMEGFRDIVWKGDKIVWTNFFKHYVYCLHATYFLFPKAGNSRELHVDDIPILASWDQIWRPEQQRLFDDIWHRFLCLPHMPNLIEALSNRNHRPIRYREFRSYLHTIQSVFFDEIVKSYIAHGIKSEPSNASQSGEMSAHTLLGQTLALILALEEIETEEEYNAELRTHEALYTNHRIRHLREFEQWIAQHHENPISVEVLRRNSQIVTPDFPLIYLNEIERLLWPNWYTACFTKHYHNSSLWGHYADNHSGVCLIFESKQVGESDGFELYYGTGNSAREIRLSEIIYKNKPAEVDFFRSIGRLTGMDVMGQWHTDEEGNISECASHLLRDGDLDRDKVADWQKRHWDTFYRDITVKTKDWEHEEEYRLILEDGLSEFKEGESRALRYDFKSLKGIIFGIKTSDDARLKIIEIIEKKRDDCGRTDFKFYQAYYSPEAGDIRKYEVQVDDMP